MDLDDGEYLRLGENCWYQWFGESLESVYHDETLEKRFQDFMKNTTARWVSVKERYPPDHWRGLVITDVRPDKPVMAHTADAWYRNEFPFADYFIGRWRDAIPVNDSKKDNARVIAWLETDQLYPDIKDDFINEALQN